MIDIVILLLLVCLIAFFYYSYPNVQNNTAASSILQVWTGNCGMSCRHSGYSRFSGMSGLNQPVTHVPLDNQPNNGNEPARNNCICHQCPCGYIENIITTCRPATDIYTRNVELLSFYLASIIQLISETYMNIYTRVMECTLNTSCQRRAQFICTRETFESTENFTFDREKSDAKKNKILFPKIPELLGKKTTSRSELTKDDNMGITRSNTTLKSQDVTANREDNKIKAPTEMVYKTTVSTTEKNEKAPTITTPNIREDNAGTSKKAETQETAREAIETPNNGAVSSSNSCPRCVKDGKVCIAKCPHQK